MPTPQGRRARACLLPLAIAAALMPALSSHAQQGTTGYQAYGAACQASPVEACRAAGQKDIAEAERGWPGCHWGITSVSVNGNICHYTNMRGSGQSCPINVPPLYEGNPSSRDFSISTCTLPLPTPAGCAGGTGGFNQCTGGTGGSGSGNPSGSTDGSGQNMGQPGASDGGPYGSAPNPGTGADPTPLGSGGSSCKTPDAVGDPIFAGTGNVVHTEVDQAGALPFVRTYNSGSGWVHNYMNRVIANDTQADVLRSDGRVYSYTGSGAGQWQGSTTVQARLYRLSADASGAAWKYINDNDDVELYDANGSPLSLTQRNGWVLQYTVQGLRVMRVSDRWGHAIGFSYAQDGRLAQVTLPSGEVLSFGYDQSRLTSITYGDGSTRRYLYEDAGNPLLLSAVIDEAGNRYASWSYDAQGRAIGATLAAGAQQVQLSYATQGASVADALGRQRSLNFTNVGGRLIYAGQDSPCADCVGDAAAQQVEPASGLVTQSTDYLGVNTLYGWDTSRRLMTSLTQAAGRAESRQTQISWHPSWRLPTLITEPGRTRAYSYDTQGNKLSETITDTASGASRVTQWSYDSAGLVSGMTDARGGTWLYTHDASGNLTGVTNPLNQQTSYAYDTAGRVTQETAPNGLVTSYTYDARGRLTSSTRGNETTAYTYTPTGQLASATQPNGYAVTYGYDAAQRLIAAQDNRGSRIQYTLDAMGNRVGEQVQDANGNIALATSRTVNNLNRIASIQGAAGQNTALGYDANGELISSTDPLNQSTRTTLDGLKRTTATTYADNNATTQAWNALDQLSSVTDPKGVQTTYARNAFGEVTAETSPDIGTVSYQRNAAGDITTQNDARGNTTSITRDALGRPSTIQYDANNIASLSYDSLGNISRIEDASGYSAYERDAQGRVTARTQAVNDIPATPSLFKLGYGYTGGDLTSLAYPSGLIVYYRRTAGRVTGIDVQVPQGRSRTSQPITPFVTNLTYTALGQPKSWGWSNGDSAARTFDTDGRMSSSEIASYTYDAASRITGITQSLWAQSITGTLYTTPLTWTASYDSRNRLTGFSRDGAGTAYTYDPNSNRLASIDKTISDSDLDGVFEATDQNSTTQRSYNIEGSSNRLLGLNQTITTVSAGKTSSVVTTPIAYSLDASGNLTSDGFRTFEYDAANRLSKVRILKDGEAASVRYLHNALGQRVFKGEPTADQLLPDESTLGQSFIDWLKTKFAWMYEQAQANTSIGIAYVYGDVEIPDWALLGQYNNGGATTAGRTEYIWLPTEDGNAIPIGIYRGGRFYAIHTDHLGTPRLMTDESNKPVWQWLYSGFGDNEPTGTLRAPANPRTAIIVKPARLAQTTTVQGLDLRFAGQTEDAEAGLVHNGLRLYCAPCGRYTQADPIGLTGGLNRVLYAAGNPINFNDPTGLILPALLPLLGLGLAANEIANSDVPLVGGSVGRVAETCAARGEAAFFRGARAGEAPSFVPRPNDFKVDPRTGFVKDTHGVSVFDNPGSVSSKGFVPNRVDQSSVPDSLRIIQRGSDPHHFEITPMPGANLTPQQFINACSSIVCMR